MTTPATRQVQLEGNLKDDNFPGNNNLKFFSYYQAMAPYLDTVKVSRQNHHQGHVSDNCIPCQSFADVPITDAGVDTVEFLQAADGLVGLFGRAKHCYMDESHLFSDLLGSTAFGVVQSDLRGNVAVSYTRTRIASLIPTEFR